GSKGLFRMRSGLRLDGVRGDGGSPADGSEEGCGKQAYDGKGYGRSQDQSGLAGANFLFFAAGADDLGGARAEQIIEIVVAETRAILGALHKAKEVVFGREEVGAQ